MPFTFTHLSIAKNICADIATLIDDVPQFYLGNIAPDAIHNRANYNSDLKKASHLCVGSEKWGSITNNTEWMDNVLSTLDKYKNSHDYSFILGYCTHILSDIYNNTAIWIPYKQKYADQFDKGYGGLYHSESNKIDINLALTHEDRAIFWNNLKNAKGINFQNVISAGEIDKQIQNILYNWYSDKELQDISTNEVVTYESTLSFINDATIFVLNKVIR